LEAEREEDVENILERCYSVGIEENHVRQNPPLDSLINAYGSLRPTYVSCCGHTSIHQSIPATLIFKRAQNSEKKDACSRLI
jgi:hypothetical protein